MCKYQQYPPFYCLKLTISHIDDFCIKHKCASCHSRPRLASTYHCDHCRQRKFIVDIYNKMTLFIIGTKKSNQYMDSQVSLLIFTFLLTYECYPNKVFQDIYPYIGQM